MPLIAGQHDNGEAVVTVDYEVVPIESEDALYNVVLWQLPDGRCVMQVWDVAARLCLDPGSASFKKVSPTGVNITCANRDRALATAGTLIAERDLER